MNQLPLAALNIPSFGMGSSLSVHTFPKILQTTERWIAINITILAPLIVCWAFRIIYLGLISLIIIQKGNFSHTCSPEIFFLLPCIDLVSEVLTNRKLSIIITTTTTATNIISITRIVIAFFSLLLS